MTYDVLVLGDYFFDQIFTGLPQFPRLGREVWAEGLNTTGGAGFITVVTLQRLGVRVGWPAHFGNDYYSRYVYDLAGHEGVDLSLVRQLDRPYRRVTTSIPYDGERAFLTFADPDVDDRLNYWQHVIASTDCRHVHIGGMMSPGELRPLADLVRGRGATLSIERQDAPLLQQPEECRAVAAMTDIFMPNRREALIIAGSDDLTSALHHLMTLCRLVVVKDGAAGVWVASEDGVIHSPGIVAGPVVDTTGAGDCFCGGFLYGYVVEGEPLDVCARYGNICGGLSVTGVGGATTAPTRDELMRQYARNKGNQRDRLSP